MGDKDILLKFIKEQERLGRVTIGEPLMMGSLKTNNNLSSSEGKLNAAIESFDILKDNKDNFFIKELLEMASTIRENLSTDESVKTACNESAELSDKRKLLLDDIRTFQMDIIHETIKKDEDISFSNCRVVDFDKAKVALSELADEELNFNMFLETEEPSLFDSIKECKTHKKTLKQVSSNCKYGKYTVLIMGDFQSGKSTTLDAFCDGRHISAIGKGTATSAVLVSATYSEKESIAIHWRKKEQFKILFDKIKQFLQSFEWDLFDLDEGTYREQLFNAIEDLRTSGKCPNVGDGDAKFLMLCSFVLHYYNTKDLQCKKESLQSLSDISDITKFPENGESTWEKSGIDGFTIDDVIFVFIEYAECFIPSNTLKDLNCTIIDSPGLFNSSYDTMVTVAAMKEAHAIMYILPYNKGMGIDVCKSLYTIRDNYADVHRKLFIVNNLSKTAENYFYETNCRQIESMFGENKPVYGYDGKLAYLAKLKKLYLANQATPKDYSHLMQVVEKGFSKVKKERKFANFDDAWSYQIRKYEDADTPIDEIIESSGFQDLITALKQFIAKNESYAVIVSNGIATMRQELVSVENSLFRNYIEPYISSHDYLVDLWKKRISNAILFQEYVINEANKKIFKKSEIDSLQARMAEDECSKLLTSDFYALLSREVAAVLYDNKRSLLVTKTLFKIDKTKFKKRFEEISFPWIKELVLEHISNKTNYMLDMMESGQDMTVTNLFAPVMNDFEKEIEKYWKKLFKKDKGVAMSDYLIVPKDLRLSEIKKSNQENYDKKISGDGLSTPLLGGLIAQISVTVAGIASLIAGYVTFAFTDVTGTSFLLAAFLGIGGTVLSGLAPEWVREKCINIISKKIEPKILSNANKNFGDIIRKQLTIILNVYIDNLKVNINKMKNERDLALTPKANLEHLCFRSIDGTANVHKQIQIYDVFKDNHLKDETN